MQSGRGDGLVYKDMFENKVPYYYDCPPMSLVMGLGLDLLVLVFGAAGLAAFAMCFGNRDEDKQ